MINSQLGKYLIVGGVLLLILGVFIYFFNDKLQWLGKLPGDIRVEKGNTKFYFPVVTMILLSLLLNLVIYVVKKRF